MTPIEELKKGLGELGIKYTIDDSDDYEVIEWQGPYNLWWQFVYDPYEEASYGELRLLDTGGSTHLTPEQAISATVGAGTCHMRHRTGLEPDETKRYVPDKTCHMVLMEDVRGHAYQDTYECDRCGERVIRETYMGKSEPPNFCPNCGARIEKEGDE